MIYPNDGKGVPMRRKREVVRAVGRWMAQVRSHKAACIIIIAMAQSSCTSVDWASLQENFTSAKTVKIAKWKNGDRHGYWR